jgi:hypothetical protein
MNQPASLTARKLMGPEPKYRLPLEPLFNVLTGAGLIALRDRRLKFNAENASQPA